MTLLSDANPLLSYAMPVMDLITMHQSIYAVSRNDDHLGWARADGANISRPAVQEHPFHDEPGHC